MIPFISKEKVRQALQYPQLIHALREAFQQEIITPKRHAHLLSEQANSSLLLMPAWNPSGHTGVKLVTVAPQNIDTPTVHAIFILFDSITGVPLAFMDGEEITQKRTAAASALASSFLSRKNSSHLLLVGNGSLAPHMALAHCHTRPIDKITIWGRSAEKSERCRQTLTSFADLPKGIKIEVTSDLAVSCMSADIITCATTSKQAIIKGEWIQAGTHLDLVGGFKPDMREVDDELMAKSVVFVDTFTGALAEAGDILQALQSGSLKKEAIVAELADLCSGRHNGRRSEQKVTVFKSVGTALEDLCAANLVWQSHQQEANEKASA